jgi:hypothetical protein
VQRRLGQRYKAIFGTLATMDMNQYRWFFDHLQQRMDFTD